MNHAKSLIHRGLTLVEILVVIVILGIIAALTIPMAGDNDAMILRMAAQRVVSDLEYAQSEAIRQSDEITVTFNTSNNTYSVLQDGTVLADRPGVAGEYTVNLPDEVNEGIDITGVDFGSGNQSVTYNSIGEPMQGAAGGTTPISDATITLTLGDETYTITVSAITGQVNISAGT